MTKKDTENAVYIAIISGAIGLLWDMLMNPCGKHWIPFFNSPAVDVACIIQKGGIPKGFWCIIPGLCYRTGRSKSSSKNDDEKKKGRSGDSGDDDDDDKGGGSTFGSGGSGSGGTTRRYKELTALSDLDEYKERRSRGSRYKELTALADEDEMDRYKERRRANAPIRDEEPLETLDDLIAKATEGSIFKPFYNYPPKPTGGIERTLDEILGGIFDETPHGGSKAKGFDPIGGFLDWWNSLYKPSPAQELWSGKPIQIPELLERTFNPKGRGR